MANVTILLKNAEGRSLSEVLDTLRFSFDYDPNKVILTEKSSCHFYLDFGKVSHGDILINVDHK